jgi:hypothetical protein
MTNDPTRIRNQPALTTSTGRIWLIVSGLFTAISLAVLIPMTALPPRGVALSAAIVDGILYLGMVAARLALRPGRLRLGLMAVAMLAIAIVSLGAVLIVAWVAVAGGVSPNGD